MEKIFDSHFHIIDPNFPLVANQGFLPEPFGVEDYRHRTQGMGIEGGVVVSGSFQAFDQKYLVAALKKLGRGFVGISQLDPSVSEDEILALHELGIRGIRFNLKRGMSDGTGIAPFAERVFELAGWHSEFYLMNSQIKALSPILKKLPKIAVDHLGLCQEGFEDLLSLVETGARVKATGFGRGDLNVSEALQKIHQENPGALMFGTDFPGTRTPKPFTPDDLQIIRDHFSEADQSKILWENAREFYRFKQSP